MFGVQKCKHVSKAKWISLEKLDLSIKEMNVGYNQIGSEAISFLCKAEWPNLRELNLCDISMS